MNDMLSNLQIFKQIKEIYDPKTAFGNPEIIGLMSKIHVPDQNGRFKTDGSAEMFLRTEWRCLECGCLNHDEEERDEYVEKRNESCHNCKTPHTINFLY